MPDIWIPITIAAAFFQNIRSALQKNLQGNLSVAAAAYSRFVFALPVAAAYLFALHLAGFVIPAPNARFLIYCLLGGVCQILFTAFLLWLFSFRSFAVGTTFSKMEVVMVAVLGAVLLGDTINASAAAAIAISACGVVALGAVRARLTLATLSRGLVAKPTLIGLACAAWLGEATVFFRGAALALNHDAGHGAFISAAAFTLFVSVSIQTVLMGMFIARRECGEFVKLWRHRRRAAAVGVSGALASIFWFTAFTLHNAAYVRALGQIELLFTFAATLFIFKEKIRAMEWLGIGLVVGGILLLLLAA